MNPSVRPLDLPGSSAFFSHHYLLPQSSEILYTEAVCFGLVLGGEGQLQHRRKTVYLQKGDFYFFPRHALFTLSNIRDLRIYEIQILPYYFRTLCPDEQEVSFRHFHISENRTDPRNTEIYSCLESFVSSWQRKEGSLELLTALSRLYCCVSSCFRGPDPHPSIGEDYLEQRIRQILTYISEHYREKLTVSGISRAVGLNPQYFSSFFSRWFHQSFIDFLNQYRIHSSLSELCDRSLRITDVALNCGFQTYKSYSNAFRKSYRISPLEYRNRHHSSGISSRTLSAGETEAAGFEFLKVYSGSGPNPLPEHPSYRSEIPVSLDLLHAPSIGETRRFLAISIGSAYQLQNASVQEQLRQAATECGFTHVHFHDLFSDLLNVYTESIPGHPYFSWESVNGILQRILDLQLHPYIELGMMPRELSVTGDCLGYGSRPCIGKPRSLKLWQQMIRSFLKNCLRLFGTAELHSWRFDFWNSANIHSSHGYWNHTREEFFDLYFATYEVFQEYSLEHLLGSPNFSFPGGIDWYDAFLALCREKHLEPGFIGVHLYSCEDRMEDFTGIFPYTPTTYNYLASTGEDVINTHLNLLRSVLEKYKMEHLPILAGEWNLTYYLSDLIRDTAFMATYVVRTWIQTLSLVEGLTFSCLSDLSEQFRPMDLPFSGGLGLFGRHGIPKPAYNAFFLLHRLDREIILNQSPCLITRGDGQWHILLYHICEYESRTEKEPEYLSTDYRYHVFRQTDHLLFRGVFVVPKGTWQITSWQFSQEHGSSYDAWVRMGSPQELTPEIIQALSFAAYPQIEVRRTEVSEELTLQAEIRPHSVWLYELQPLPPDQ
ncbi:MAG: helix-turn-helix domain-containing protein [Parasporobacterium sp.]|nr:helix-turn-helix domain-containing protein [Parasporobacterium sp.]